MTKRLIVIFFIALSYFLIIIPVQSQQQDTGEQPNNIVIANEYEAIQLDNNKENPINDTGQDVQIEEISSGSINLPQTGQNLSINNFETGTTWEIDQINTKPQIILSEIYYDGTEEWIEITNLGLDFSGEVELLVPQPILFPVSLQQNQSIILTKSSQTYSRISPLVVKQPLPLSFSFTDTKAIFIQLQRSWQTIDTFQVETGLVVKYNDKKTSLTKQIINQIWSITGSSSAINVISPYLASPGFFDFSSIFQTGDQNQGTGWSGNIFTGDIWSSSWSDLGGGGMSGIVDAPTPTSPQPDTLSITEIYKSNWLLSDFIEIQALQDFSGKVFFSGSLLKTGLNLDLFLKNQERIIIVYFDNWWLSGQEKIKNTSLELNTSWYLQVLGQSGQVFDTIQVLSTSWNKSNYNWDFSNWYIDIFSEIDDFSPGFDEQFLVYNKLLLAYTTWQVNQDTWFSDQTGSWGLSTGLPQNWQDLSWTTSSGYQFSRKNFQITALSHLNPETITIKSNLNLSLDLSKKDRYLLSKEISTSNRKTTKKYLTGILLSGESLTISKTRGFLDAGSCIGLFYQTGQLDERCYGSTLPQQIIQEQEPELEDESEFIPNITIIWVLPNPLGKDDQEELHLLRTGSVIARSQSDVAIQNFQISDKYLYLKINSTKKYLTGIFSLNQEKILIGSLGLVNKPVCAELRYRTTLLDTYCYPQPQEGQYLEKGKENIQNETGLIIKNIPNIHIQWLLPNPKGKDDQELISLFRTPETKSVTGLASAMVANSSEAIQSWSTSTTESNLSFNIKNLTLENKSLYLLNNNKKTYFSWSLQVDTGTIFKAALGLINKAHCVELRYLETQLDKFCYPNPKEDQYFGSWNIVLQTIQKSDFLILQDVWFIVTGSQICVRYFDQMLTCRQLPASKTSIKLKNENKLYKTYVGLLQNYLIKNRSTLYFNTPINDYFTILKNAKSQIKDFSSIVSISGQQFNIYDLSGQIELTTAQQWLSWDQIQETTSWLQKFLIWLGI